MVKRSFDDLPKPLAAIVSAVVVIFLIWLFFFKINPLIPSSSTTETVGTLTPGGGFTGGDLSLLEGLAAIALVVSIVFIAYLLLRNRRSSYSYP
ncbi:MAG: hypothetical protein ABSB56_04320 [Nitrososphaerales archaeon]